MSTAVPAEWQTESLRLTAFPVDPSDATKALHWQPLISTPAEAMQRPPQTQQVIEEGPWNNARLQVVGQPGQVHWRTFSLIASPEGPNLLGPFASAVPPFRALMTRWLTQVSFPVNRIAFGANVLLSASSLPVACRSLDGMLPSVKIDRNGTRDFMYRINRRRGSVHDSSLQINRLATWSVIQSIGLEVVIGAGVAPATRQLPGKHFCRLELDVNTVPRELRRKTLSAIFDELVDAAIEIAEQGDVP